MSEMKKYRFIINPVSGELKQTQKIIKLIKNYFSKQDEIEFEIKYTERAGHATDLARQAVQAEFDAVVSVGGDGTMNEVASALVNTKTALAILPRGSGNGYARSLQIPLKLKDNLQHLLQPQVKTVDVGKVNQYYFFGICGIGFDAEIGAQFQNFGIRGPVPYFYLGLKEYFKYEYETVQVISDQKKYIGKPMIVVIANTREYGLGAIINPAADYSDGKFEVCIVEAPKFYRDIFHLRKLFNGSIDSLPIYKSYSVERVKIIRSKQEAFFHTDGEPRLGGATLEIQIIKKALRVLV